MELQILIVSINEYLGVGNGGEGGRRERRRERRRKRRRERAERREQRERERARESESKTRQTSPAFQSRRNSVRVYMSVYISASTMIRLTV